jgi:hypothetical protein
VYESDAQERVADVVITENPADVTAAISDNELAVILQAGEFDAAYTAEEAREFTRSMLSIYHQRGWGEDMIPAADYIQDLADVVDDLTTVEVVEEKWEHDGQMGAGGTFGVFDGHDGGPYMSFASREVANRFCDDWNELPDPVTYHVAELS